MATTIQVSEDLASELKKRKMYEKETYEEIIWDLIEDSKELSKETIENIKIAEKEFKEGKTHSLENVAKELGIE